MGARSDVRLRKVGLEEMQQVISNVAGAKLNNTVPHYKA